MAYKEAGYTDMDARKEASKVIPSGSWPSRIDTSDKVWKEKGAKSYEVILKIGEDEYSAGSRNYYNQEILQNSSAARDDLERDFPGLYSLLFELDKKK